MNVSPVLALYRIIVFLVSPVASLWLAMRARGGKEDPTRLGERFGRYTQARPEGRLFWLHAASVGESSVALALVEALAARDPALSFLVSTGTRTSADLVARRALPRVNHVYAPLDRDDTVRRFLAHWCPDAGAFVESEVWPNLILAAQARSIPLALVNARMSPSTLKRWRRWPAAAKQLLGAFASVSAADTRTAEALALIRGAPVEPPANLKLAAPAPTIDAATRAVLVAQTGARRLWLAASTHAGEDEIVLEAHAELVRQEPSALLIIAPRHPERGEAIAVLAGGAPRRSQGAEIGDSPVYVADTLGELGLFYSVASVALVAGSLLPHLKGHNPVEPAKIGAAIVTGPYVESFQDVFDALNKANGATTAHASADLAAAILRLWRDDAARTRQCEAASAVVQRGADALERTVSSLHSLIHAPA